MADTDPRVSYGHSRHRSKSSFSFKSAKSDSSDANRSKINPEELKETEATRRRTKWATVDNNKDPNRAISEITPAERAQAENTTLPALKQGQLRDWKGDVISDPDASNPTRPRMERPLDTIRSFEAAIDKNYTSKQRLNRSESADNTAQASRRSSFVGGYDNPYHGRQSSHGSYGYNNSRGYSSHREYRDYRDGYGLRPGVPRHSTAPSGYHPGGPGPEPSTYPSHGYHESYDTVNTGDSYNTSGSEPWTNSTDPSSENSSVDRIHGGRQEYNDAYGNAYSQPYGRGSPRHDPIQEEYVHDGYSYDDGHYGHATPQARPQQQRTSYQQGAPPPAPPHQQAQQQPYHASSVPTRKPMPAPSAANAPAPPAHSSSRLQRPPPPPKKNSSDDGSKRKSWLRRRFSKG